MTDNRCQIRDVGGQMPDDGWKMSNEISLIIQILHFTPYTLCLNLYY